MSLHSEISLKTEIVMKDLKDDGLPKIEDTKQIEGAQMNETASKYIESDQDEKVNVDVSDDLADACETACRICDRVFTLSFMRHHVKEHSLQITKYKKMHGDFRKNLSLIIKVVVHKCHICDDIILLDNTSLSYHLKRNHKSTNLQEYKDQYMIRNLSKKLDSSSPSRHTPKVSAAVKRLQDRWKASKKAKVSAAVKRLRDHCKGSDKEKPAHSRRRMSGIETDDQTTWKESTSPGDQTQAMERKGSPENKIIKKPVKTDSAPVIPYVSESLTITRVPSDENTPKQKIEQDSAQYSKRTKLDEELKEKDGKEPEVDDLIDLSKVTPIMKFIAKKLEEGAHPLELSGPFVYKENTPGVTPHLHVAYTMVRLLEKAGYDGDKMYRAVMFPDPIGLKDLKKDLKNLLSGGKLDPRIQGSKLTEMTARSIQCFIAYYTGKEDHEEISVEGEGSEEKGDEENSGEGEGNEEKGDNKQTSTFKDAKRETKNIKSEEQMNVVDTRATEYPQNGSENEVAGRSYYGNSDQRAIVQNTLSVKIGKGEVSLKSGHFDMKMNCENLEISGNPGDVVNFVTKSMKAMKNSMQELE